MPKIHRFSVVYTMSTSCDHINRFGAGNRYNPTTPKFFSQNTNIRNEGCSQQVRLELNYTNANETLTHEKYGCQPLLSARQNTRNANIREILLSILIFPVLTLEANIFLRYQRPISQGKACWPYIGKVRPAE